MTSTDRAAADVQPASGAPDDEDADPGDLDIGRWRDQAADRLAQARVWVRANPLPALGIAIAAGFLAGRMVRR